MSSSSDKKTSNILVAEPCPDYALLDSGCGEKLERFGSVVLSRPDPQALWDKALDLAEWKKVDGSFTRDDKKGEWNLKKNSSERWQISFGGLKFWIKPTPFKHVGLFPEQISNWQWMKEKIESAKNKDPKQDIEVLNLFGYTGGATLACAESGAKVVHVDGSKAALTWARENSELSGLDKKPIRWILDDVRAFVKREVKRGRKYHGIIMDPPAFGHGAKEEVWKIEEDLMPLLNMCQSILADQPIFFIINGYSAGYSALAYENLLLPLMKKNGGSIEKGELAIREKDSDRLLPCGIFARWSR